MRSSSRRLNETNLMLPIQAGTLSTRMRRNFTRMKSFNSLNTTGRSRSEKCRRPVNCPRATPTPTARCPVCRWTPGSSRTACPSTPGSSSKVWEAWEETPGSLRCRESVPTVFPCTGRCRDSLLAGYIHNRHNLLDNRSNSFSSSFNQDIRNNLRHNQDNHNNLQDNHSLDNRSSLRHNLDNPNNSHHNQASHSNSLLLNQASHSNSLLLNQASHHNQEYNNNNHNHNLVRHNLDKSSPNNRLNNHQAFIDWTLT